MREHKAAVGIKKKNLYLLLALVAFIGLMVFLAAMNVNPGHVAGHNSILTR